jgi:starch-binding outer membrane protein, SusD/RagB family
MRHLHAWGTLAAGVVASACNTTVTSPDVVTSKGLQGAAALPAELAGAYANFAQAYLGSGYSASFIDGQAQESQVLVSALFTDEMHESDFYTNHLQIDLRSQSRDNTTLDNLWYLLHRARVSGDQTAAAYAQYDSTNPGRLTMLNLAGYSSELLAESFCGNIPLGTYNASAGAVIYGPPLGTDSVVGVAKSHFRAVLALAALDTQSVNAPSVQYEALRAAVGLARALAYEDSLDAAATVAATVPDGYADSIERSANSPAEQNGVYYYTNIEVRYGVTSGEGGNGLNYLIDGANGDPRIPIGQAGIIPTLIGYDDFTLDTIQQRYPQYGSSGPLASAAEARLIQAEDYLLNGNPGMALAQINKARQDVAPGMPGLGAMPTDPNAQIDTLFAERAYDLWLTGHRVGDLRRLVRPTGGTLPGYGRDQATEWPTGTYFKNGQYGTQVALLVPRNEDNNPQYSDGGCNQGLTP